MRRLASVGLPKARSKTPRIRQFHAHGCEVCAALYRDACDTPMLNARCSEHRERTPRRRVLWDRAFDPVECCRTHAVEASVEAREAYALGGPGPWWQCTVCARPIPYDPGTGRGQP